MYRVYIADDEQWIILGIKKRIEKSGLPFQVVGEANNGVIALEEIEAKQPDIIFLDIRMPGYTGLELMELLRSKGNTAQIILISGHAEFEYAQTAIRNGAFDYLLKPIEQEQLQEVLERIISKSDADLSEAPIVVEQSTIQKVIDEIKNHYLEGITLTGLADKYMISASRLSEIIKENLQMSFSDYITSKRIQRAKELLTDESLSIDQIAEMTGYNDYFYFTKVFKKIIGISPSKYRKNLYQ